MNDPFEDRLALARKMTEERRFADAIVLFDWLCEQYPDRAAAVIDSANALSRVFDYDGVSRRFAHVESFNAVPADAWLAMAEISERLRRPAWARRYLSNAVAASKTDAEPFGIFALFLERANDLSQAAELVDRGLGIDPSNGSCRLAKIRLLRREKLVEQAIKLALDVLSSPSLPPRVLISTGCELARLYDQAGDCAAAMDALTNARRTTAALSEFARFQQNAMARERLHHGLLTSLNADYFNAASQWKPARPARLALLAGHPRSGTTLLEQIIDSHTGVVSAEETTVFGNGVHDPFMRDLHTDNLCESALAIPTDRLDLLRWNYFNTTQKLLDHPIGNRLLLDKNPSYTDCIPVFARVFPEASYIIALRDPRDVVLSCFFQDLPVNEITVNFQSLKETAVRYANTMAMWLVCREYLDPSRWIEVRYEALVNDLPAEAGKVMKHLQLDWQSAQSHPDEHARNRTVISPTYADVRQPVHQSAIGKWKRYQQWLAPAMPVLETFIEAFEY